MKKTVTVLIENAKGEFLMLLRDDKPTIPYPNQWYIPGGIMEEGETPEEAIKREMLEELELDLSPLKFLKTYYWPEKVEHVFHIHLDLNPALVKLHEGQKIQFFSKEELLKMKLAFHDSEIISEFFGS